jgi:hypothetical protein
LEGLKGRHHLEDKSTDERIISKIYLRKNRVSGSELDSSAS